MKKQIIKVGFDLDGVILYNPIRGARSFAFLLKKIFLKSKVNSFYIPKTTLHKSLWSLLHKTSVFPAKGYEDVLKLIKHKKIKAYVISGRYKFLKNDFDDWIEKLNLKKHFEGIYMNENNNQPYDFKEKILKQLQIDIFIEDNWDIVKKLNQSELKTKIYWITNFIDKKINYKYKFSNFKKAIKYLQEKYLN